MITAERDSIKKDLERKTNVYENKIKSMKDQYELKISILENSIKYQKEQFSETEEKAILMLKKQENVYFVKLDN